MTTPPLKLKPGPHIFVGTRGYYIATMLPNGSHVPAPDQGASMGYDRAAADRELARVRDNAVIAARNERILSRPGFSARAATPCTSPGCSAPVIAKGLCSRCYQRVIRGAPPAPPRTPMGKGNRVPVTVAPKALLEALRARAATDGV